MNVILLLVHKSQHKLQYFTTSQLLNLKFGYSYSTNHYKLLNCPNLHTILTDLIQLVTML